MDIRRKINRIPAFLLVLSAVLPAGCMNGSGEDPWDGLAGVIGQIDSTSFPEKDYSILDFGAVAGSRELSTKAINTAIAHCSESGGGRVVVPAGIFTTGAVRLLSNVNLHLEEGAMLRFSTNPGDYLPVVLTRWEGVDCYNYSPLIYAADAENIAITGKGMLDGQASDSVWWWWKGKTAYGWDHGMPSQLDQGGRPRLFSYMEKGLPVEERIMGDSANLRPPFVQFRKCRKVLIEDVSIRNSPFWIIHPLLSESIIVRGVKVESHGPNNDGCDPESCKNVLIEGCYFDTGDDCIAIKSGRNGDGRKWDVPSENIVVRKCEMKNGHGGVVIGSEISGGCRNVFVEDCRMNSPELDRAIRIKTNTFRGGVVENVYVRNLDIGEVDEAVFKVNCLYELEPGEEGDYLPMVRHIRIEEVRSRSSEYGVYLQGLEGEDVISDILISNCRFDGVKNGNYLKNAKEPGFKNVYMNGKLFR